jgi:putative FmdB family regulatory protein
MPLYVYRCPQCEREVEELQRFDDPPPESSEICPSSASEEQAPCRLERVISVAHQRWNGDYSNDGRGGWQRQGDAMVKLTRGKESTRYGEGVG